MIAEAMNKKQTEKSFFKYKEKVFGKNKEKKTAGGLGDLFS